MKIKITYTVLVVCISTICCQGFSQTNYSATNTTHFLALNGIGEEIPAGVTVTKRYPDSYPFNRIAGENSFDEMRNYVGRVGKREPISEIMPVEIDTNGNWGDPVDDLSLSARFRQNQFIEGKEVPVLIILRNSGTSIRSWWRNNAPDYGYQFTLTYGTNSLIWERPQQPPVTKDYYQRMHDLGVRGDHLREEVEEGDPFLCKAEPHTEDLTILDLNRFFDLHQPGQYSLKVQITAPNLTGGTTNVVSGVSIFEIVQSPKN